MLSTHPKCPICLCELRSNCFKVREGTAYCATCWHDVNAVLHIALSQVEDILIRHGHMAQDAGINFYCPRLSRDSRMAAHLVAKWLKERGFVPFDTVQPPTAAAADAAATPRR